jgi:hypothetical protein
VPLASPAAIRARTEWSQAAVAISGRVTNLKQAEAERVGRAELRKLGVYLLTAWRVRVLSAHKIAVDIPALATKRGIQPVILDRCVKLFEKKNSWSQLTEWQAAADAAAVAAVAAVAKDGDVEPPPTLVAASDKAAAKVLEALQELERLEREKREMKDKPEPLTAEHEATLKLFLQDKNALFKLSNDEALPFFTAEAKQQFAELQREQEQQAKLAPPEPLKVPAVTGGGAPMQINVRGNPDQLGDIVPPGFLQVLGESDVGFRSAKADASAKQPPTFTRLDLANAITDRNNPLTARVYVNRVWHHLFGRGLVNTPSNFGQLGERPSHPELLDTLAVRFMEAGWSTKWLLREIVLSATYRLSNQANTTNEQLDADNVMLWRMTPRRLDFEAWRDATLAVAGKLDRTIGGPPLQPDAKTQLHPEDPSHGRRTLYCFISRFKPNPTLTLFDFPEPNVTSERRNLTMIPQQQLFALNSPFIVAMAKEMAARLQREETTDEARVRRAWRLVYCRLPSDEELTASLEYVRSTEHDWPRFCHAVLSSNEFIFLP